MPTNSRYASTPTKARFFYWSRNFPPSNRYLYKNVTDEIDFETCCLYEVRIIIMQLVRSALVINRILIHADDRVGRVLLGRLVAYDRHVSAGKSDACSVGNKLLLKYCVVITPSPRYNVSPPLQRWVKHVFTFSVVGFVALTMESKNFIVA